MSSKSLPRVLTIYLLVLAVIIVAAHASSSEEEICRDGRCYPRVFAPTTDFTEVLEGQRFLRDYTSAWTSTRGRKRPSSLTPRTRPLAASFSLIMRENLSVTNSPTSRRGSLLCQRNRLGSKSPSERWKNSALSSSLSAMTIS